MKKRILCSLSILIIIVLSYKLLIVEDNPQAFILMICLIIFSIIFAIILALSTITIKRYKNKLLQIQKKLALSDEIIQKDKQIIEAKELLDTVLEASKAGIWEINLSERMVSYDDTCAELLEIKAKSPITVDAYMEHLKGIKLDNIYEPHFEYIFEKDFLYNSDSKDLRYELQDGTIKELTLRMKIQYDKYGNYSRIVGMFMDITNDKLAELPLQKRLKQQKLMSDIAQSFVYGEDLKSIIQLSFKQVGRFIGVNYLYLYKYNQENSMFKRMYEWIDGNTVSINDLVEDIPEEMVYKYYLKKESANVYGAESIEFPEKLKPYNSNKNNIHSFINFPIIINDALWGYVGIANLYEEYKWKANDHHLFTLFAGLVATGIKRNNIEQDLNKAERTLRTIIDNISKGIFWKDLNSTYEGCNELFTHITGISSDKLIGSTSREVFPKELADRYDEEDRIALSMNLPYSCEETILTVDGKQKIIHTTKSVIYEDNGKPIRIVGVSDDVTESRMVQIKMEDTLNKLQTIMENFDGLIFYVNNKRIITIIGGASIIGANLTVGKKVQDVYAAYPIIIENIENTFKYGQQDFNYTDGSIYTQCSVTPLKNNYGMTTGVLFMEIDTTKQFIMQKQLEDAIIEAQRASNAKSEFLSRMSHEIRTPMNAIIGMTKIALGSGESEKKQYCLEKIDTASKNLLELINQILDMSKIEADKLELTLNDFDFEEMMNEISSVISVRLLEKAQKLTVNYMNEFSTVLIGDELRLSQVITNLLSNAVKFTPEGGNINVSITKLEDIDDEVIIKVEVKDNGIGINKEHQNRLFNSFEQADGGIARKYGGSGLGLAISKKIVNLMKGEIWIESEEGKGSSFIFTVQLKKSKLKSIDKSKDEEAVNYDFSSYTALLAEDIEINMEIVITILEDTKINCVCAENGKEALEIFTDNPEKFDLILMDIHMPEMDGYEAAARIRSLEIPKASKVPIIAMTANAFREDVEKCRSVGMNDHVAKPIDSKELLRKINKFIKMNI